MTAIHDAPAVPRTWDLLDAKCWEHLGITGDEFRSRWWAGRYRDDHSPATAALDHLMRTGQWWPMRGPAGGYVQ
jgi:hypothetical protein